MKLKISGFGYNSNDNDFYVTTTYQRANGNIRIEISFPKDWSKDFWNGFDNQLRAFKKKLNPHPKNKEDRRCLA